MPVDFLSGAEAARYGRYDGAPTPAELDKVFFLDDDDKAWAVAAAITCGWASPCRW